MESYGDAGLDLLAMEWLPRTTRAHRHGRALLAGEHRGYKAVILAAKRNTAALCRCSLTAAGKVKAARVLSSARASRACRRRHGEAPGAMIEASDCDPR